MYHVPHTCELKIPDTSVYCFTRYSCTPVTCGLSNSTAFSTSLVVHDTRRHTHVWFNVLPVLQCSLVHLYHSGRSFCASYKSGRINRILCALALQPSIALTNPINIAVPIVFRVGTTGAILFVAFCNQHLFRVFVTEIQFGHLTNSETSRTSTNGVPFRGTFAVFVKRDNVAI